VFFYWSKFVAGSGTFTVLQTENSTNANHTFLVHQGWVNLFTGTCTDSLGTEVFTEARSGTNIASQHTVTITSPSLTPGTTYILGIKYNVKSLVDTLASPATAADTSPPATVHYTFETKFAGTTVDQNNNGLDLVNTD